MNSTLHSRSVLVRRIAAACGAGVLLVGATACGNDDTTNSSSPTTSSTSGPQTTQQGGQVPGANGKVAAVDGSTAQVQSQQNGQVAVTWTSSTAFTKEVEASLAEVKVGDCVMVTPAETSSDSADDAATKVTAASVRITAATGGTCAPVMQGGPAGGPGPSTDSNGAPPTGAPPGGTRLRGSFGAFGEVTAVSGSGFTVKSTRPGSGSSDDSTTTEVVVTTTGTTTYATTAEATEADVKVGSCVAARGKTDATGAVTATTIALSTAVDGECGGGIFRSRSGDGSGASTDSGQES